MKTSTEPASSTGILGRGRQWVRRLSGSAIRLVIPPNCSLCGADQEEPSDQILICERCCLDLPPLAGPRCRRCAARTPVPQHDDRCPQCRQQPFAFDEAICFGAYATTLRTAILQMKRPDAVPAAQALTRRMVNLCQDRLTASEFDIVVPVPMHWRRRVLRGYNSAEVVAETLARGLRLPWNHRLLCRHRPTLPQADLPPGKRFANVRGAFRVHKGYDLASLRVLLVDDVMTTGATCSAAAKALKKAGAARVAAVTLALAGTPI